MGATYILKLSVQITVSWSFKKPIMIEQTCTTLCDQTRKLERFFTIPCVPLALSGLLTLPVLILLKGGHCQKLSVSEPTGIVTTGPRQAACLSQRSSGFSQTQGGKCSTLRTRHFQCGPCVLQKQHVLETIHSLLCDLQRCLDMICLHMIVQREMKTMSFKVNEKNPHVVSPL